MHHVLSSSLVYLLWTRQGINKLYEVEGLFVINEGHVKLDIVFIDLLNYLSYCVQMIKQVETTSQADLFVWLIGLYFSCHSIGYYSHEQRIQLELEVYRPIIIQFTNISFLGSSINSVIIHVLEISLLLLFHYCAWYF